MLQPFVAGAAYDLRMVGLGRSVGTRPEGITAEAIVVKDFAELDERCDEAFGKIVVWNLGGWVSYGANQPYRTEGASAAAKCGGLASLSRSVGPYSLETPHTGSMTHVPSPPLSRTALSPPSPASPPHLTPPPDDTA